MLERYFTPNDLPHVDVSEPGLYAIANHQPSGMLCAGQAADKASIWWQTTQDNEIELALTLRASSVIRGLSMIATYKTLEDGLPIAFSQYLTELRTKNKGITSPCLISIHPPHVPPDHVRIPHLVAYEPNPNATLDVVIWELLTQKEAMQWLGAPLPDQRFVEGHLPDLLRLRMLVRTNQIPETTNHAELKQLLSKGRYLSMLFVYQHYRLFQSLFKDNQVVQGPHDTIQ